jgi:nitrate reductase gamma subunit
MVRHVNPWNTPVRVHTYAEYEDEFRQPMIKSGIPIEIDKSVGKQ